MNLPPGVRGQTVRTDRLQIRYLESGPPDGIPVVMLHGNPTWSFYYRDLVKALRTDYRVIVPDHIGCGLSDKPDVSHYPYTLARRVKDLETLLEQLGITDNITLVLHDWGGMIGMAWAVRRPERVKRLVVLNTSPSKKSGSGISQVSQAETLV